MTGLELIRFILGSLFLGIGVITYAIEIIGVFKQKVALNRMHAAGMGDTLGLTSSLIGLMILSGLNLNTVKMIFIIVFLWFTSPVCTHLLAQLEVTTDEEFDSYCEDKTK